MTTREAQAAAEALARPWGVKDASRIDAYAEQFAQLERFDVLMAAITGVIATYTDGWMPPIGHVREAYRAELRRARAETPALNEPAITEDERRENLRMAQDLVSRYSTKDVPDE